MMMMMKKKMGSCQAILLLGFLSTAASNSDLINCKYDRNLSLVSRLLKEYYSNQLDSFLYRNYLKDKTGNAVDRLSKLKNYRSRDPTARKNKNFNFDPDFSTADDPVQTGKRCLAAGHRPAGFNRRNPLAETYKRGPGFRSWGGKRTFLMERGNPWDETFGSEKASTDPAEKGRKVFVPAQEEPEFKGPEEEEEESGNQFPKKKDGFPQARNLVNRRMIRSPKNSRGFYHYFFKSPIGFDSRKRFQKFSSWGGKKRSEKIEKDYFWLKGKQADLDKPFSRNFHSWGGKRGIEGIGDPELKEKKY